MPPRPDGKYLVIEPKTYYDLVELDRFLEANYDEFRGTSGTGRSFHRAIQQGEYGQDSLTTVNLEEWEADLVEADEDYEGYESIADHMHRAVLGLRLLVRDGHLPEQDEYTIYIWW